MKKGVIVLIVMLSVVSVVVAEEAIRNTIDISVPTSIIVDIIREMHIDVFLGVFNDIAESNRALALGIPLGGTHEITVRDSRFKETIQGSMPIGTCNYVFYTTDVERMLYAKDRDYIFNIGVWDGLNFREQTRASKGVLVFDEEYPLVRISLEAGPEWDPGKSTMKGYFEYRCK
tara:strand:- start:4928 stop:5449 length:522 start_codon:yes stop_codon:yes gene_type:complete